MNKYNKKYFETLNYGGYLSRRDRYLRLAREIHELLITLQLVKKSSKFMDYGCAVGFLMEGLNELGYRNTYGYDISRWASAQARSKGLNILKSLESRTFDVMICLDVLEHMTDSEINKAFDQFKSEIIIVRIPCSIDRKQFVLDISNKDRTHINLKTKGDWINLLNNLGYTTLLPLDLFTIYDTPGVMCALGLKAKAYYNTKSSPGIDQ